MSAISDRIGTVGLTRIDRCVSRRQVRIGRRRLAHRAGHCEARSTEDRFRDPAGRKTPSSDDGATGEHRARPSQSGEPLRSAPECAGNRLPGRARHTCGTAARDRRPIEMHRRARRAHWQRSDLGMPCPSQQHSMPSTCTNEPRIRLRRCPQRSANQPVGTSRSMIARSPAASSRRHHSGRHLLFLHPPEQVERRASRPRGSPPRREGRARVFCGSGIN